ncbi:MAG: hypothetical protein ABIR39_08700 [Nocardioides sp.]|uniref:hypothetical protein n=1 Tax=Nocardioides sp. TaxID=35761 RepID=UPI0032632372
MGSARPRRRGRRLLGAALAALILMPLVVLAAFDLRLASALDRIHGAFDGLDDRPPVATDGSVTTLMLATGDGLASSPALTWMRDDPAVVTAMLVTVSGDRRTAYVDWLPLNEQLVDGLADARPSAAVSATEAWTGRRVDHLAVVEWSVFSDLGRDNEVPAELAPGTGRREQQAYLREVLKDTLHTEMRKEPWTLYRALHTVASGMAVEDGWSAFDMNRLVFSMRNMRSYDIILGSLDEPAGR